MMSSRRQGDLKLRIDCYLSWYEIQIAVSGRDHAAFWVPSHGKNLASWEPPEPHQQHATLWRELNEIADGSASEHLMQALNSLDPHVKQRTKARSWATAALGHLRAAVTNYGKLIRERIAQVDLGSSAATVGGTMARSTRGRRRAR